MHAINGNHPQIEKPESTEVFRLFANAIEEHLTLDADGVRVIVNEEIGKKLPKTIEVKFPSGDTVTMSQRVHAQFESLMSLVDEGHSNLLLVGPAGSGKTTLAKNLAEALALPYGFISLSAGVTETHLMGRTLPQSDGSWKFVASKFVEIYTGGGVFLLDEIDAADANVMVAINAALANGHMVTPDGTIHTRHEKCLVIAAANTWGRGADLMYVGRNQLDASTLDRFVLATVHVQYDEALELELVKGAGVSVDLFDWVQGLRTLITRNRLRRVASTRLIVSGIKAMARGKSLDEVKTRYFQDWSADEKAKVSA